MGIFGCGGSSMLGTRSFPKRKVAQKALPSEAKLHHAKEAAGRAFCLVERLWCDGLLRHPACP